MNPKNGTATAPAKRTRRKTEVILQKRVTIEKTGKLDAHEIWEDISSAYADAADAHKKRKASGEGGKFRIIRVLDEFKVAHEQTTKEVITRSGQ